MPKHIELLTKHIAAGRLGLSPRRVLELSDEGKLTRHRAVDPATKREASMFDAAEVDAFAAAQTPTPVPLMIAAPAGESDDGDGRGDGRLWLTLGEAAAYTGLPVSHLLGAIGSGELAARDVGPRPGGHWRIRRLDLDAIAGRRA